MDFKIGDEVKIISETVEADRHLIGMIGKITHISDNNLYYVDFGVNINQTVNTVNDTTHKYVQSELELVKDSVKNIKPDDMVRYMVYGAGCNNCGRVRMSEKELKEDLKKHIKDGSWSGRIIGYRLVPLYEAELKTHLKVFKTAKIKKIVNKKVEKTIKK